jgi:tetratricopeptide (TPR) repeat protein
MDADLLWTIIGSSAGVLGVLLVGWQIRLQLIEHRESGRVHRDGPQIPYHDSGGLPVAVPLGRLPAEIRGRSALLTELRRPLKARLCMFHKNASRELSGGTWVLAGMGGLGKSTVALAVAQSARAKGWRTWWVSATDGASLAGGMLEILSELEAPETVTKSIREGAPAAVERAWEYLNGPHRAGRKWLLIFDNADSPAVLAAPGTVTPADHTGWLRADPAGMVIVTTRNKDPRSWRTGVRLRELTSLDDTTAAEILSDLAPGIPDPGGVEARELSRRLGGLPLALRLAGAYLGSPFARRRTFADYRKALDSVELPLALDDIDDPSADARATIQRTWDLSLDALAADGAFLARPLLLLLACFALAIPIPACLLMPHIVPDLRIIADVVSGGDANTAVEPARTLRSNLLALSTVGLIDIAKDHCCADAPTITVHPVVADVNRSRLRTTAFPLLPVIAEATVRQLRAAIGELDEQRPDDWPTWQQLVPHIWSLLKWLAGDMNASAVAALLDASSSAASALSWSGNTAGAEDLAAEAVAAGGCLGNRHPASIMARRIHADAVEGRGRDSEAEELYRAVLADQEQVLGEDHPDTLATRHELAKVIGHNRYPEAELLFRKILADRERVLGSGHRSTLATRHELARAVGHMGRGREAELMYRQVLAARSRDCGHDHPSTLVARHGVAWALGKQGRFSEAEQSHRTILSDQQRILGADHPDVLSTRQYLAWAIANQGRSHEAERLYREVIADHQRILGEAHPSTLFARRNMVTIIVRQGKYAEAEQLYRRIINDENRIIGNNHPMTLETIHNLACTIGSQGRYREAEQLYCQVLAERQRVLGEQHPATLTTARMLELMIASQGT